MRRWETPSERAAREFTERYAASVPYKAVVRQAEAADQRHPCCWEPSDLAHHPLCKHFVEPDLPPVIDGQESLL